jgi:hypothetical protein
MIKPTCPWLKLLVQSEYEIFDIIYGFFLDVMWIIRHDTKL